MIVRSIRLSSTRQYKILSGMKQRCYNPNSLHFDRYGARGISICDEWLGPAGALNFYNWSLSHGYADNLTIDRINNDIGYCPENCVWISGSFNTGYNDLFHKILNVIYNCPTFEEEYLNLLINQVHDVKQQSILLSELSDVKNAKRRRRS